MRKFKIGNRWIYFPYVPYGPQEEFVERMLESLDKEQSALLESPTGTGKTLCLLCGALGHLDYLHKQLEQFNAEQHPEDGRADPPEQYKIFFCSRTHSQLMQAVQELKNTAYEHMRVAVLGARKHLCLHPARKDASSLDTKCRALRRERKSCPSPIPDIEDVSTMCLSCTPSHEFQCQYYANFKKMEQDGGLHVFSESGAFDQLTLKKKSKKYRVCPFYVSRHLLKQADIVFLPYSYVFNPHIRRAMSLKLQDSIVIIDEGHNIDKVCEENASFEMKVSNFDECQEELIKVRDVLTGGIFKNKDANYQPVITSAVIRNIQDCCVKVKFSLEAIGNGQSCNGDYLLTLFSEAGFSDRQKYDLEQIINFGVEQECKVDGMRKIFNILLTLFLLRDEKVDDVSVLQESFRLHKEKLTQEKLNEGVEPRIYFWCFDAGVIMRSLKMRVGVRSFIVTSGTLSPLGPLRKNLGVPFEIDLINKHVVDSCQVLSICVGHVEANGVRTSLDSTWRQRKENGENYYRALGKLVLEVAKFSPKGMLMFFPSSTMRDECLTAWEAKPTEDEIVSLWDEINSTKEILLEPKEACNLNDLQEKYKQRIDRGGGAFLIGVLSGKVSEGIDFKNDFGRAVIMVGPPFAPIFDPWVLHKKEALRKKGGKKAEQDWNLATAMRPVNQAIGRIIRHRKDYGAVILADYRYRDRWGLGSLLPEWLRRDLRIRDFENLEDALKNFFQYTIPVKMKEIDSKVVTEQAILCKKHEEEQRREEVSADEYFDLKEKKKALLIKGNELNEKIGKAKERYEDKLRQVSLLRQTIYNETRPEGSKGEGAVAKEEEIKSENPGVSTSEVKMEVKEESEDETILSDFETGGDSEYEELDDSTTL